MVPERSHASLRAGSRRFLAFGHDRLRRPSRGRNVPHRFGPSSQLRLPYPWAHASHGRLLMARWMRLLWPRLTSHGISSMGSPRVRTRCFPTQPPHLPPRTEPARLRCVVPARLPRRPSMRFLFIGSSVSSSLPSHGRLPSRSWPRVVVFSCFHVWFFYRGLAPHLQRAHAGHTHGAQGDLRGRCAPPAAP